MNLAFFIDPLAQFNIAHDSSFAMMREAQQRGHRIHTFEQRDLRVLSNGRVVADMQEIILTGDTPPDWYTAQAAETRQLADVDAIIMRKDPPFDMEYLYATHILEHAERQGARIFNRPRALRDFNEKLAILRYPQWTAPTLITSQAVVIREFLAEHKDIILKPLDGMGGMGIFRIRQDDPNIGAILETQTQRGKITVMLQRYLPEIQQGDKRILLIAGKPVDWCLARIATTGETRANIASGGRGVPQKLSASDKRIAETLGPALWKEGLLLVGLDVIGEYVTEINVTSPTCFQEIAAGSGINVAGLFVEALESALSATCAVS